MWLTRGGGHAVLYFSQIIQTGSNLEIENRCLTLLPKFPIFHAAILGYYEQFSQLCRHPILNRIRVKNPETYSTFESLMNFKRDLNLLENLINSPKFILDLIFTKVNLVRIAYMQDNELQYKRQMAWFE
jgi:hypothetical protein